MTPVGMAATILLLRDTDGELEVFLVQRHRRSAFMPHMWVFPGGRVEDGDAALPPGRVRGAASAGRLGHGGPRDVAVAVGGIRETFEEAGIWLGDGALPQAMRAPLAQGEVALADLLEHHDATVDLSRVHPWARWVTPEGEARRFDTTFLTAIVQDAEGAHDTRETVDSGWFRPEAVLHAGLASMGVAPPTWWALTELAACGDVAGVRQAIARRHMAPVAPIPRKGPHGFAIVLPGHPDHPEAARPGLPRYIGMGPDGWVAELA